MAEKLSLDEVINQVSNEVDQKMQDMIKDPQILSVLAGGKRLRSLLAYLAAKSCATGKMNVHDHQRVLEGMVVIELAHAASLVHDDIIDDDKIRRGKPALHVIKGVPYAMLVGHKMLIRGLDISLHQGMAFARLYLNTWNEAVSGELDEIEFNGKDLKTVEGQKALFDVYSRIIDRKTAVLFSASCKAGALYTSVSDELLKIVEEYGREIGFAYQLADDLADLINGETISSVVIPLLSKLEIKTKITMINKKIMRKKVTKHIDEIQEIFINKIRKHVMRAEELARSEVIPLSNYKMLLQEAPRYVVNKTLESVYIEI